MKPVFRLLQFLKEQLLAWCEFVHQPDELCLHRLRAGTVPRAAVRLRPLPEGDGGKDPKRRTGRDGGDHNIPLVFLPPVGDGGACGPSRRHACRQLLT